MSLPRWNLADLYNGIHDPLLISDKKALDHESLEFAAYENTLSSLSATDIFSIIGIYENLQEKIAKLMSYAFLVVAENRQNTENSVFFQGIQEYGARINQRLLFFPLELNTLAEHTLSAIASMDDERYAPWLRDLSSFKPHQLTANLERLSEDKSISSRSNWIRLYDEYFAALKFPFEGEECTATHILKHMQGPDAALREKASKVFGRVLTENISIFSLITNTLARDKEVDDMWRGYSAPISYRNKENRVSDEAVESLIDTVRSSYSRLSHRYYKLKAKIMGTDVLPYWDRNAPVSNEKDDGSISFSEAQDIVLSSYRDFSPRFYEIGKTFFDNNWIHAALDKGKDSGAFSHPVIPSVHPYILLNYQGFRRDVSTLAHELGHGIHQVLAASQGLLVSDTPLTLAETASVFGEMLTFDTLLARYPSQKKTLLAGKIDDMMNTTIRQIAFVTFEKNVHAERRATGELSVEKLNSLWMESQAESLGPCVHLEKPYDVFWSYIPHFIHAPFYVYAYAFGDCLVNTLYSLYKDGHKDFVDLYTRLLQRGGRDLYEDALTPFGLDAKSSNFWQRGLQVIEHYIDQFAQYVG